MDERLGPLFVALLVVAALGAAAATFDDPERAGGGVGERTDGETDRSGDVPGGAGDYEGNLSGGIGPIGPGSGDAGRGLGGLALPLGLALGVVLWAGLAVVALRRATGDDRRRDEPDEPGTSTDAGSGTTARPPWRPAATNGVAEAWTDLARRVDVAARRTRTPGEVADRAIEAGYGPEGVRELTALFERVRYGAAEPTAALVTAARDALARSLDRDGGRDPERDARDPDAGSDDEGDGDGGGGDR